MNVSIAIADHLRELDNYAHALAWGVYNANWRCVAHLDWIAQHDVLQALRAYNNCVLLANESFDAATSTMRIG